MTTAAAATPAIALITCERGLGRMQASACAKRWSIANAAKLTTLQIRAGGKRIVMSPCRGCPHGEKRADAGEHLAAPVLVPAASLGLIAPPARAELPAVATVPAPTPPSERVRIERPVQRPQEEWMPKQQIECVDCGKKCERTGPRQQRCPECALKHKSAVQRERRGGQAAAEPAARTHNGGGRSKPEPVAGSVTGYRVRIGNLEIECANLPALLELVDTTGSRMTLTPELRAQMAVACQPLVPQTTVAKVLVACAYLSEKGPAWIPILLKRVTELERQLGHVREDAIEQRDAKVMQAIEDLLPTDASNPAFATLRLLAKSLGYLDGDRPRGRL